MHSSEPAQSSTWRERMKRAREQAARDGRWLGGRSPIGWNVYADGSATLNRAAAGEITKAQLSTITARVQTKLEHVKAKMISPARDGVIAAIIACDDPVRAWASAPIDRQRALVRELLTVTVLPSGTRGTGFDPALVRVEWREA